MESALNTVAGRLPLSNRIVKIGSSPDNQLVLQDPKASPLHAGIRPEELGYSITDPGSASGTFVNGQWLEYNSPRLLYPGDTIRIGDTVFTYELSGTSLAGAVTPGNTGQGNNAGVSPTMAAPEPSYYNSNTGMQQGYEAVSAGPIGSPAYPSSPVHSTSYPPYTVPSLDPIPGYLQGSGQQAWQPQGVPIQLTPGSLLRKEHRRELWTALGILGAVLVIGFIVFANLHSPERTLDTFCNALRSGDYQTAYNQLSPGEQSFSQSEVDFANSFSHGDRVVSCSYTNVSVSGNSAITTVTFTGSSSGTSSLVFTLIQDSSFNWRIDGFK
jgi:hypothetical protein